MNERIRQIAEEAKEYSRSFTFQQEVFQKKFAELIVKDCVTMCDELNAEYLKHRISTTDFREKNRLAEGENACTNLRHQIEFKFGVKK